MDTYIRQGTQISLQIGTKSNPKIVRWTSWDKGSFQQSYALFSSDGIALVDPVRPRSDKAVNHLDRLFESHSIQFCSYKNIVNLNENDRDTKRDR